MTAAAEPTPPTAKEAAGFLIWTKAGRNPRFWHGHRESAEAEAGRLAAKHPGTAFFVVAMLTKHKVAAVLAEAA